MEDHVQQELPLMSDEKMRKGLGARIKAQRKQKGWSQKELASQVDVGFSLLNKYEGGFHAPPVDKLAKLAEVLDTTVDYLLLGERPEAPKLHNKRLMERFKVLEAFEDDDQDTVIKVIDAIVARRRMQDALRPIDRRSA